MTLGQEAGAAGMERIVSMLQPTCRSLRWHYPDSGSMGVISAAVSSSTPGRMFNVARYAGLSKRARALCAPPHGANRSATPPVSSVAAKALTV
ncbi:protein of unknown function [Methylocella tundrae]|uniref:Uncharacterized protein n=1 Tax=Methylocella tundrae TaxID=227605 RepID=A0A4U8Z5C4_METTU|nr:protein of unknown function [Methylocella tundrae]